MCGIISFNTGLHKSAFSTYLFGKLVVLSFCTFCVYFSCVEFNVIFLKELRNRVLRIIFVWSLFRLIRLQVGLHLQVYTFLWKTSFSSFCVFCVFCFESNVLNQDIEICVILLNVILLCNFVT